MTPDTPAGAGRQLPEGIASKFRVGLPTECWLWTGAKKGRGYGAAYVNGKTTIAHRAVYELMKGPIPDGMTLDHLCRNRGCVNPAHLEPVTNKENILRGISFSAINARKTACDYGHAFTPANTYMGPSGRECRTCRAARVPLRPWAPKLKKIRQRTPCPACARPVGTTNGRLAPHRLLAHPDLWCGR